MQRITETDHVSLGQQLEFLLELEKLKSIFRRSYILDTDRWENDAEHSWQLAVMAIILSEHANEEIQPSHVMKMVLLHDIVEIDAGDTFCYDEKGHTDKADRELRAAKRIFGILPPEQQKECFQLWQEFERGETREAKFANALDRLMPLMLNYYSQGKSWKKHGIRKQQVIDRNKHIAKGSTILWDFASTLIDKAVEKGYLAA
ncbi:HD domain-containing protein [Desulfogranum japonicum]|uniref:HD domain-containing protein n=1 Tax=Desulfogranum japonicum TaxID=231447 RepID=UPI00041C70DA|nr:HD domain-containing protein [Desulfogranum japonicum]